MMRSWVRFLAVAALGLTFATQALAQTEKWNQEKVTAIAKELEAAVSGLRDAVKKSPAWENPQQKRNLYKISDILRQIEQECTSLHAQLAKGAGMEESLANYEHIQRLKRRAEVLAPKSDITAFTKPKLDQATGLLKQIEPYYPAAAEAPKR